jgi:tetratricopeptide (TPR) repeat protein
MTGLLRTVGLTALGAVLGAGAPAASIPGTLELRGKIVDGARRARPLRITVYGLESTYTESTLTDPGGEFRFHKLNPGPYSISMMRGGLGEVRRTVEVTASLADKKGVVRVTLPFSPAEAAASGNGALVSRNQLAIPSKARRKYEEARQRMAKHDSDGARLKFEEAVQISPEFSAAWNALGVLDYQHADYKSAEEHFRQAVEAEPASYEPQVNLGGVLLNLNRPEDALAFNQRAAEMRPKDALANAQLGMNYFALGRADNAERYLKAAEQIDPAHFSQPQWFLAAIYMRRGDRAAAARELRDLMQRHPDGFVANRARRALARIEEATVASPEAQAR